MSAYQRPLRCLAIWLHVALCLGIVVIAVVSSNSNPSTTAAASDVEVASDVQSVLPTSPGAITSLNPNPPSEVVKLVFIHHSCGDNWLDDGNGGLGAALGENNYYVSDTYYDWGPDGIGSYTDVGHWWSWFRGPKSATYLSSLYGTNNRHADYSRLMADPGGENEIILFKSCYPNSDLKASPDDPPPTGDNSLRGQDSSSPHHTVGNAKGIYNDILEYFETRQDKLFVVITAPPRQDATYADNARAFNNWLVDDWLDDYPYRNVAVFDFYNVLTTNGGNAYTNDYGWTTGNHHRVVTTTSPITIEHLTDGDDDGNPNVLEYPTGDDHPSWAGNQKATGEFVPLLNAYYNCWKHGQCWDGSADWISLAAFPAVVSVHPGEMAVYTVSVTADVGSVPPVTLTLQEVPSGVLPSFDPNPVTPPGTSRLHMDTAPSTLVGIHPMTVTGDAGVLRDTARLALVVATATPSFTFSISPTVRVAKPDETVSYTTVFTGVGGFSFPVSLEVVGKPAGVDATWTVNPVLPGESSTLNLALSKSVLLGDHTLYVVGTAGTQVVDRDIQLIIDYPFKIYLPIILKG